MSKLEESITSILKSDQILPLECADQRRVNPTRASLLQRIEKNFTFACETKKRLQTVHIHTYTVRARALFSYEPTN